MFTNDELSWFLTGTWHLPGAQSVPWCPWAILHPPAFWCPGKTTSPWWLFQSPSWKLGDLLQSMDSGHSLISLLWTLLYLFLFLLLELLIICTLYLLYQASLVAQWLRIRLPMQGTRVRALVREDPTCRGATKPVHHNYWACALEAVSHNYWSLWATTTEPAL